MYVLTETHRRRESVLPLILWLVLTLIYAVIDFYHLFLFCRIFGIGSKNRETTKNAKDAKEAKEATSPV